MTGGNIADLTDWAKQGVGLHGGKVVCSIGLSDWGIVSDAVGWDTVDWDTVDWDTVDWDTVGWDTVGWGTVIAVCCMIALIDEGN